MQNKTEFNGLLLIDKQADITSFGVISRLRALTGIKKIGHCGTLDPFATGMLPVLFGRYTKLARYLEAADRTYYVEFVLGAATDTLDKTGKIVDLVDATELQQRVESGELDRTLQDIVQSDLTGEIEQIPPMYSAIKIAGKPLYKYARDGQKIIRQARKIKIYQVELSKITMQDEQWICAATISCSKGTYIRTWIDDLGRKAKCYAYAKSLSRQKCGNLELGQSSITLAELFQKKEEFASDQSKMRSEIKQKYFYPIEKALSDFPQYHLNLTEAEKVIYGQKFELNNFNKIDSASLIQLLYNNKLLAIVSLNKSNQVQYQRVLADKV
ncbi:MAG TPA: tRNA pseudouridine(55) synthase TruB [Clostridiaceae bacterium]|nr:tRNA pseudouridine(55) synthase TruB [Clostridiaceae bacterium]